MAGHLVPSRARIGRRVRLRRRPEAQRTAKLAFDRLEPRCLLSVSWDGGGGDSDWNNPLNWNTDQVPASQDTAVIDLAGTFTVNLTTDVTVAGLTLGGASGTQTLSTGSHTLTINGPGTVAPHGFLLLGDGTTNGTGTLSNQGTVEWHGDGTQSIDVPFENATTGSVLRMGSDAGSLVTFHFAQGVTNHGLIESTTFSSFSTPTVDLVIGDGTGKLVNAPDGTIHVVPGVRGGLRRFRLTLDNQGTVTLDHPLELDDTDGSTGGPPATNTGTITARAASLTVILFSSSSFTNSGTIEIGDGQTLLVSGLQGSGIEFTQAGTLSGPGTLDLEGPIANFVTNFSNAETPLRAVNATLNGPGTLHFGRDQTFENVTSNAAIVNDAILTLDGANINGPFVANPGSTLRVPFLSTFADAFTNHGTIELRSGFGAAFFVSNGTLVNAADGVIRSLSGSGTDVPQISASIDNQGLIEVEEASLTTNSALTTSGTVRIGAGQTLSLARLDIAAGAVISADGPASLNVVGIGSESQDPNTLANLTVNAVGAGFFGDVTFEAMSEDRGPVSAGFDSNFALHGLDTIAVPFSTQGGDIKLVDNVDNSPGSAPEAVYADSVVLVPVTRLDLNGLHLYTRALSIAPSHIQILNGTIQVVGDGGPLALNEFEPGNIGAVNERDEWQFTGRAGQTVSVVVKTGGTDVDAPLAPQIGFAQLELTDSTGASLGVAANTTENADAVLLNTVLPADGVYKVFVSNPPGHTASNNNYQIGVFDASVRTARAVFHQPYVSQIADRFAVDRWTFSGVAGQNIRLDVLDPIDPSIQFALRGPNGSVFESVNADTVATLPADGQYELIVGGTQPGTYRFQLDEVAPTALTLGTPFTGTEPAGGFAQLFRVHITDTQALSIVLNAAASAGHNELYAKIGSPPTRSDYQFASFTPGATDQSVLIPAAAPGDWFILVYGEAVPQPAPFTLLARSADVFVNDVTPHAVPRTIIVTPGDTVPDLDFVVEGSGFRDVTKVEILDEHGVVAAAQRIKVDNLQRLHATFLPTSSNEGGFLAWNYFPSVGNDTGPFTVRVTNRDGSVGELANGINILPETNGIDGDGRRDTVSLARLDTDLIMPSVLYPFGVATLTVVYKNAGLLPMPAPILELHLDAPNFPDLKPIMTLDPALVATGSLTTASPEGFTDRIELLATGRIPGVLEPGESREVPVYLVGFSGDIPFHQTLDFAIDALQADSDATVDWASAKDSLQPPGMDPQAWDAIFENYLGLVGTTGGDFVSLLDSTAAYLGSIGEDVTDVHDLNAFVYSQADGEHPIQSLTHSTDASVSAPGLALELTRSFPNTITTRYRRGVLGRGWFHSWETSLAVDPDGAVTVITPTGVQRTFNPDRRPFRQNSYFSALDDHGTLTRLDDGSFDLLEADGQLEHYAPDGKLAFMEDTNGNRITAAYTNGLLTRLEHSSGQFFDLAYNSAGLLQTVTDSDGRVVKYSYDAANEHLVQFVDFDGEVTHYTYTDGSDIQQKNALASIETPDGVTRHFLYDDQGRYASTFLNDGDERIDYSFGPGGEVRSTDLTGATFTLFMDRFGGIARIDDPLGNSVGIGYSDNFDVNRLTDPLGQSYAFHYDSRGNLISSVDPLGDTYHFSYGAFSRLTSFTDSRGNVTQNLYDAHGNLISTIDALGETSQITYDALGNPIQSKNRRGQVITNTFNADGLLTSKTHEDGSSETYGYDDRGRLTSTVDAHGTTTYEYDNGDRMTRVTYPGGRFLQYTYDSAGRRSQMVDQTGFTVNYSYDTSGRLAGLSDATGAAIVHYSYDVAGRLDRKDNANGTFSTFEYDSVSQLRHILNHAPDGSINSRFDYTYDSNGNRTSMDTLDGKWTYKYDAIGQLTHAVFDSTNPAIPDQDLTYEYDAMGNRTRTIENGVVTDYTTNALNQYTQVGSAAYQYDADGNLISMVDGSAATNLTWDDEGRLTGVTSPQSSSQYEYDALDYGVATVENGTRTEFLNDPTVLVNAVAAFNGAGDLLAHFVYGQGLASHVDPTGQAAFYDFDAIGSTVGMTNAAGTYSNKYVYRPFGATLSSIETIQNPFQFVGLFGVAHEKNGLDFMRHRWYSTLDGRFVSKDPTEIAGGLNLYRYTVNNPVLFTDPLGLYNCLDGVDTDTGETCGSGSGVHMNPKADAIDGIIAIHDAVSDPCAGSAGFATLGGGSVAGNITYNGCEKNKDKNDKPTAPKPPAPEPPSPKKKRKFSDFACDISNCDKPDPNVFKFTPPERRRSITGRAIDPNSMTAIAGFGVANFVAAGTLLPYRIDFENDPTATAPAQRVDVSDQLSDKLDWNTLEFTEAAFGDQFLAIPAGSQFFHTVVDVSSDGTAFQVSIDLDFNSANGQLTAQFQAIDPTTGLPFSGLTGLLPPEDGSGRGLGHFSYVVHAKAGLATGTAIRNVATIQFDFGEIIDTNQVDPHDRAKGTDPQKEALVTIDAGAPSSRVLALPAVTNSTSFVVSWSGSDDASGAAGSGIASFDVFVSDNGGAFTPFRTGTILTSAPFTGQVGHTYGFYTVATDNVGHRQPTPAAAQATTRVAAQALAVIQFGSTQFAANVDAGSTSILLTRAGDLSNTVTVVLSSPGGQGVTPFQKTISFAPQVASQLVPITIVNDGVPGRSDIIVPLHLSSPGSGASLGAVASASLVVHDNNVPFVAAPSVTVAALSVGTVKIGKGRNARTVTSLVVQFSGDLNPAQAHSLAAYHVLAGTIKRGRAIFKTTFPLFSATYNPAARTVTLALGRRLHPLRPIQLRINAGRLTDSLGRPLDGDHNGQPGGDFIATIKGKSVTIATNGSTKAASLPQLAPKAVDHILASHTRLVPTSGECSGRRGTCLSTDR